MFADIEFYHDQDGFTSDDSGDWAHCGEFRAPKV